MVKGKKELLSYFDLQNLPYFTIYQKSEVGSGRPWATNTGEENIDVATARPVFESFVQHMAAGEYRVFLNDKNKTTEKGAICTDVRIGVAEDDKVTVHTGTPAGVAGLVPEGYVSKQEAEQIATDKFQQMMLKHQLEDLKAKAERLERENKELSRAKAEPWDKFLVAATPHIPQLIAGIFGTNQVAGIPANEPLPDNAEVGELSQEEQQLNQQVTEDFVMALYNKKPNNWRDIIKALTRMIKEDPNTFEMALTFLKIS